MQPTTAVVQVSDDGSATLYLGTEPVEHANGVDAATVMRVLVDYAATIDAGLQITTQMPDGTWTRHRRQSYRATRSLSATTGARDMYGHLEHRLRHRTFARHAGRR